MSLVKNCFCTARSAPMEKVCRINGMPATAAMVRDMRRLGASMTTRA